MANLIPDFDDLHALRANGEDLVGKLMNNFWQDRQIATDIKEYPDRYEVKADLPGIQKEDITLHYGDDVLSIVATQQKSNEEKDDNGRYLRRERSSSSYQRSFTMRDIDEEKIKATFDNGVLHLILPKKTLAEQPGKTIPID